MTAPVSNLITTEGQDARPIRDRDFYRKRRAARRVEKRAQQPGVRLVECRRGWKLIENGTHIVFRTTVGQCLDSYYRVLVGRGTVLSPTEFVEHCRHAGLPAPDTDRPHDVVVAPDTAPTTGDTIIMTYRYKVCPTREQHIALGAILEDQRRLYNLALEHRIDEYQRSLDEVAMKLRAKPRSPSFIDQSAWLTGLRTHETTAEEYRKYPVTMQRWTLKRLDDAYQAFFKRERDGTNKARRARRIARGLPVRKHTGFPHFRSRDCWRSFGFRETSGITFDGKEISFRGLPGGLRLHLHRPLPGDIAENGHRSAALKSIVLTRDPGGRKWWISLQCEVPTVRRCQSTTAAIGIDVGISTPIMQSDGGTVPLPKSLKRTRKAERRAARALARAKRGSKRREKAKRRLARIKEQSAAARKQFAHVQSARLTKDYAIAAFEELSIDNMTRSAAGSTEAPGTNVKAKAGLNREILNVGWGGLITYHKYKAKRDGSRQVLVDPRGTSQLCSGCGAIVPKKLSQRVHHCTACGLIVDRDENAAKNILARALSLVAGTQNDVGVPPGGDVAKSTNGSGGSRRPGNTTSDKRSDGGHVYDQEHTFDSHPNPDNRLRKGLISKTNSSRSVLGYG